MAKATNQVRRARKVRKIVSTVMGWYEHDRQTACGDRRKLEGMGYTFTGGEWLHPANDTTAPFITDALHALIIKRAEELAGCTVGSEEERELAAITDAIEAYESVRWPKGRTDDGKG